MKHKHRYETFYHPVASPEAMELGIKSIEIKKCSICEKEMPFLLIRGNKWIPLYKEEEPYEEDILLA
jgi:hypothetical protein